MWALAAVFGGGLRMFTKPVLEPELIIAFNCVSCVMLHCVHGCIKMCKNNIVRNCSIAFNCVIISFNCVTIACNCTSKQTLMHNKNNDVTLQLL